MLLHFFYSQYRTLVCKWRVENAGPMKAI